MVVALASHHLVTPALHPRLVEVGLAAQFDDELRQYFETIADLNRNRNLRISAQLVELVHLLARFGIQPIFLKGTAHLLLGLYRDIADRVIGDVDLLVEEEDFKKTIKIMTEAGYVSVKGHAEHAHHHHYPPLARNDSEACVEVHKSPVPSPYDRALPTSMLAQRARPIQIGDNQAAIPCPQDLLVHNIVHSQLADRGFWSSEFLLRDAYDLILLTHRFGGELDWRQFDARLNTDVGKSCSAFYLLRAHQLFGQRLPPIAGTIGARLADWRWTLHARGKVLWLRRMTRGVAYASQSLLRMAANPSKRRHSLRRLLARSDHTPRMLGASRDSKRLR